MKVYVAGASKEVNRAVRMMQRLRDGGVTVTSTWPEVIRAVGQANPKDATVEQYIEWASKSLSEVRASDALWLLIPEIDAVGAYIELGVAHALDKLIVASGAHRPIFTNALAKCHSAYDAEIATYLIDLHRR